MKTKPNNTNPPSSSASHPPVDFAKKWTNGHKCYCSQESRAHAELLATEGRAQDRYETIKSEFVKPRNPVNGEITPRDARGEAVLNPAKLYTVKGGIPLFPPTDLAGTNLSLTLQKQRCPKPTTVKVGVNNEKYDILGNTIGGIHTTSEDLFHTVRLQSDVQRQKQEELYKKNEFIAKEKAKRYQNDLERQMFALKRQMEEKEKEIAMVQKYF